MTKRLGAIVLTAATIAGGAAVLPYTVGAKDGSNLTVHEWGTFTSVAGPEWQTIEWRPLTGPTDLPCFVTTLNPNSIKIIPQGGIPGLKALVRMETPVLYFYSPSATTARVSVSFPQGLFSEWYPQATVGMAQQGNSRQWQWQINWSNVAIAPGAKEAFPTEPDGSHYYAARETDAAPVSVDKQQEKFLFYRGIANFSTPVKATVTRDGKIAVAQGTDQPIGTFVLFERRGPTFGYRIASTNQSELTIERPVLGGTLEALRQELRTMLTERGLYPREAAAMVETWRDSWFEEGTRLFYFLPQVTVDRILPIDIDPKPSTITRVFVGRIEVVTPDIESDVAAALRANDQAVLRKYGRFLEPISQMVYARLATTLDDTSIHNALMASVSKPTTVCQAASGGKTVIPTRPPMP